MKNIHVKRNSSKQVRCMTIINNKNMCIHYLILWFLIHLIQIEFIFSLCSYEK